MKYRKLGDTGLIVSELALGTMQFGGRMNMGNLGQEDATRTPMRQPTRHMPHGNRERPSDVGRHVVVERTLGSIDGEAVVGSWRTLLACRKRVISSKGCGLLIR